MTIRSSFVIILATLATSVIFSLSAIADTGGRHQFYSGPYEDLFKYTELNSDDTTAEYYYYTDDDPEELIYDGSFKFNFDHLGRKARLTGSFSKNVPEGIWTLTYPYKFKGTRKIVDVTMTIPYTVDGPSGNAEIVVSEQAADGGKILERDKVFLKNNGESVSKTLGKDKIGVSINDVLEIIRSIPPADTEIMIIDDGYEDLTEIKIPEERQLIEIAEPGECEIMSQEDLLSSKSNINTEQVIVKEDIVRKQPEKIFYSPLKNAVFPGGEAAMMKWVSDNIQYPATALQEGTRGRVIVQFVVEKDGSVTNPKVLRSISPELDKEAIRVINAMPVWTPAENNGEIVRSYYIIPVTFRLPE